LVIAYSLIAMMSAAAVVLVVWLRYNSYDAKYKRRMTLEREKRGKLENPPPKAG
jgi:hypothetical protein